MTEMDINKLIKDRIGHIEKTDIVVGIPSYNNAGTIGHVVRAVQAGMAKYFPRQKAVLVNSDGGSTDGTMDVVNRAAIDDFHSILLSHRAEPFFKVAMPYGGIPGKGSAFRTIFQVADILGAQACAVVDSDLRSITPEWVELLIKPVLENGFDYVAPLYQRHKFDGTITNSIIYPLTRALYGKRIRQPIGGDFGFSGKLARFYLTKDVWETDVARYGIDIWMTVTAIANDYKICQSYLGAKIHDPKDPGADLSAMLHQVVGAAFDLMKTYEDVWKNVTETEKTPVFGFIYDVGLEPVNVNVDRMIEKFRIGVQELESVWRHILRPDTIGLLKGIAERQGDVFRLSDELWVEIIYGFALAFQKRTINREHILKSLTSLYLGRTASFIVENMDADAREVEEKIEALCLAFEKGKGALGKDWV